ncbi:MAG TPA: hypothetical protein VGM44_06055 [Polyangiaceae bacterium]|jgi:hypothetical protein
MTRFAWILNLDAELELARLGFEYVPRTKLSAQLAEYGRASRALVGSEDILLGETLSNPEGLLGRAWCPTPRAVVAFAAARITPEPHPASEVLRRVNHRMFAHQLGGGLPEQKYFTERAPIEALLRRAERRWLVKRPLAFAGRGQMRFYGAITKQQWSWLELSLERDGVIVEPLVTPKLELSLHGFVWRSGRLELGRICVQEVSERGVFRTLRLAHSGELLESDARALFAKGEQVADALFAAGYFGPFGIDAYRYELDGESAFCALSEINARYTMGFVTGFPRHPSELSLA